MLAQPATPSRPAVLAVGLAGILTVVLAVGAIVLDKYPLMVLAGLEGAFIVAAAHRFLLQWRILVATIVLVILLIPIGRYTLPGGLPFALEPYRVLVALVATMWAACLLADRRLRWRSTGLAAPLMAFALCIGISAAVNFERIGELRVEAEVIKELSMFASFFTVMLLASCVIRSRGELDTVVKAVIGGGAVVAIFSLIQYRTGFNAFDNLERVIPILDVEQSGLPSNLEARGGGARVYGSAQHPIALSAALVLLLPLGIYLAQRTGQRRWWMATGLIAIAALATVARTGTLMLVVEVIALLAMKPRQMLRLWPLAIPFLVAVHIAVPGTLGGLYNAFNPQGGLVAEQQTNAGKTSSNRIADLGPSLEEWSRTPFFGQGFGTRITNPTNPLVNSLILDNQWLGTLLETGMFGVAALLWLFVRSVRRLGRGARRDDSAHGWLLAGLAAGITGYGVGMLTFDAFAFSQVTFIVFMLMGLAIAARRLGPIAAVEEPKRRPRRRSASGAGGGDAGPPPPAPRVRVARNIRSCEALRPEWQQIPWSSPDADIDYFMTFVQARPEILRPHVISFDRPGRPPGLIVARLERRPLNIGVGPLALLRPTVTCLTVVADGVAGADTPADQAVALAALRGALEKGEADVLCLSKLPVGSPLVDTVRRRVPALSRDGLPLVVPHTTVAVPDSLQEFLAARSRNTRENVKRYGKRLERDFGPRMSVRAFHSEAEIDELCEQMESVAAMTYQRGMGVGFRDEPEQRELMALAMRKGWFRAWVLSIDGVAKAFWYGVAYRGTFFIGSPGYDPALSAQRIGVYLQMRMMEDLCTDDTVQVLDYGFGDAQYKRSFGDTSWEEADVLVFALTPRATLINGARTASSAATRLARRLLGQERAGKLRRARRRRATTSAPSADPAS